MQENVKQDVVLKCSNASRNVAQVQNAAAYAIEKISFVLMHARVIQVNIQRVACFLQATDF